MSERFPPSPCPKCLQRDIPCDLCMNPKTKLEERFISPFKAAAWLADHPGWVHDTERELKAVRPEDETKSGDE